jgi:putative holliday junction resolvase
LPIHRNLGALGPDVIGSGSRQRPSALGFDVSKRAIGLAGADPTWTLVTPLSSIRRTRLAADLEALGRVIRERDARLLVLGWPLNMNGSEGPRCQSVMAFAREVDRAFDLPIVLQDERLSTFAAKEALFSRGKRRGRTAPDLDALAAAQILEGFLDAVRRL